MSPAEKTEPIPIAERAARYVSKMPPAIQGQYGSDDCYLVAQTLVRGFDLSDDAAWPIIQAYNKTCEPSFSEKELRHKLASARKRSKKSPGYLLGESARKSDASAKEENEPPISDADYVSVATAFLAECGGTFHGIDDVRTYLGKRLLVVEGERAGLVGLPSRPVETIKRLGKHFSAETLANAGLWNLERSFFPWHSHKLLIPWRSLDGSVHRLQRRHLDQEDVKADAPKYLFPKGLKPLYPFGCEALRDAPPDAPIVICEGALDVLAIRTVRNWRGHEYMRDVIPLGVPGVGGWRNSWAEYAQGRDVWIALDTDKAGDDKKTIQKITDDCHAQGAKVKRWRPPEPHKDWAQFLEIEGAK